MLNVSGKFIIYCFKTMHKLITTYLKFHKQMIELDMDFQILVGEFIVFIIIDGNPRSYFRYLVLHSIRFDLFGI